MTSVFVAEIAGRPVIALNAEGVAAAEGVLSEPGVRADLLRFQADGKPVWDGEAEIYLRDPYPEERALWEDSFFKAVDGGGLSYDEAIQETWICLLVAVNDPTWRAESAGE
jgi:hypothetical protein